MRDHAIRVRLVGTARSGQSSGRAGVLSQGRNGLRESGVGMGWAVLGTKQREAHNEENGLRVGHRGCGRRLGLRAGKFPEGFGGDDRRHPVRDAHDLRRRVSRQGQKRRRFDRDRGRSEAAYRKRAVSRRRIDRGVRRDRQQQRVLESSVPTARHSDVHDRRLHRPRHCQLGRRSIEARV